MSTPKRRNVPKKPKGARKRDLEFFADALSVVAKGLPRRQREWFERQLRKFGGTVFVEIVTELLAKQSAERRAAKTEAQQAERIAKEEERARRLDLGLVAWVHQTDD